MVIATIELVIKEQYRQLFIDRMSTITELVAKEDGCLQYVLSHNADNRDKFILYERWDNIESLQKHINQPVMENFYAEAGSWYLTVDVNIYETKNITSDFFNQMHTLPS